MAVVGEQVALTGGTRAKISRTTSDAIAGQSLVVFPATVDLFFGDNTVTTGNGAKLPTGASISLDLDPREDLYVIAGSNVTVHILHTGV